MKMTYKIVGLFVEKFIDEGPGNDEFSPETIENERYILYCTTISERGYKEKEIITLEETYGWCGSGWTTASWGRFERKACYDAFGPFNYKPKSPIVFTVDNKIFKDDDFEIEGVMWCSNDGNDSYYPSGGVWVNMDLFEKVPRAMDKRPVWLIYGPSGTGKSTLGLTLASHYRVFETDSVDELPDVIDADIVIVGNKHHYKDSDITKRLFGDPEINLVCINKG